MIKFSDIRYLLLAVVAVATTACGSMFDDEGDCEVHYVMSFRYDHNMKFADAFRHEVGSVHLFAYDASGACQLDTALTIDQLAAAGYKLEMNLEPGRYSFVAWGGANHHPGNEHFNVAHLAAGRLGTDTHACCRLLHKHDGTLDYHDENLHPLYYGALPDTELPEPGIDGATYEYVMPLIKDTNQVRIVLQHLSGEDVNVDDFVFSISAANGEMLHDNSIPAGTPAIEYRPWAAFSGSAGVEVNDPSGSRAITNVSVARADLTIPRMTTGQRQSMMLTIKRHADGGLVARIPVIDYALLVKELDSSGRSPMDDQEYLDRQDSYSMMFFLDERDQWVTSQIIINSWRIVLQSHTL